MLNEWKDSDAVDISNVNGREDGIQHPKGSAILYTLYDTTNLYVGIDVIADTVKDDFDQIGLYIDFNGDGYWPSPASADKEGNWWVVAHSEGDFTALRPLSWDGAQTKAGEVEYYISQLQGAVNRQSGHMQYECSIKLEAIGNLKSGESCKIWVFVLDEQNSTFPGWWPSQVTSTGKRPGWLDPLNYGSLYLEPPI